MSHLCLATKYDHPDDPSPMLCVLSPGHDGDHRPAGHGGDVWCTWPNEEGGA